MTQAVKKRAGDEERGDVLPLRDGTAVRGSNLTSGRDEAHSDYRGGALFARVRAVATRPVAEQRVDQAQVPHLMTRKAEALQRPTALNRTSVL
jgi:hypothetical protein